jgi:hypothetical protein
MMDSPAKARRGVFGISLHGWEQLMLFSLLLVFATTAVVVILQRREAAEATRDLAQYKLTVEGKVADAKKEGIEAGKTAGDALLRAAELEKQAAQLRKDAAEANAALGAAQADIAKANAQIAGANERAAALENEAAQARVEQERLKAQLAWRAIEPGKMQTLRTLLANSKGTVFIEYAANDPEATYFAIQIARIFDDRTHWTLEVGSVSSPGLVMLGLFVRGKEDNKTVQSIRAAFTAVKVPFLTDPWPNVAVIQRSGNAPRGNEDAVITVGSKALSF